MKKFMMMLTLIPENGNKFHIDDIRYANSKEELETKEREFCATYGYKIVQMIVKEMW